MNERARRHLAAVAAVAADDAVARRQAALDGDVEWRLREGLRLAAPFVGRDPVIEAEVDRRALAQVELHRRWRRIHGPSK